MSEESTKSENENGLVDAFSAVAIVVIPVVTIVYWLSGMPTS